MARKANTSGTIKYQFVPLVCVLRIHSYCAYERLLPTECSMNPRDNLKRLDIVIMLLTMVGMALAAFKTVVTVIALYMLATLDIRRNMT